LLAAKSQPDAAFFGKAMIARDIHKTYLCLVTPSEKLEDKGVIDAFLRREDIAREAYCRISPPDHKDAQEAYTAYEVIARTDEAYLIKAMPKTGRMHQLRVHFAHLGAPILGDVRYGGALRLSTGAVGRLMLHALSLDFPHPQKGRLKIDCPLPDDFSQQLQKFQINFFLT
jgi:tRNA pseudouridine32 synthase/23S rRNA pseudouridine746 synthase